MNTAPLDRTKILRWCDIAIEVGFIAYIIVAPIREHTGTIKSFGAGIPLLAWVIKIFLNKKINWVKTPLDYPFALFILISLLSIFVSVDTGETIRALKNFLLKHIVLYFTIVNNIKDDGQIKRLLGAIVSINIVFSSVASFNYLSGGRIPGSIGAFAFSLNHIGLAQFLVITIPMIGIFYSLSKKKGASFLFIILFLLSTLAIILTYSRTGWLTLLGVLIVWGAFKDRKTIAIFLALGFFFAIIAAPLNIKLRVKTGLKKGALQNRPAYWKAGLTMVKERPLLGFGYSHRIYKHIYKDYRPEDAYDELPMHVHNTYLAAAVEMGIPGVFALLWIFYVCFKEILKGIVRSKNEPRHTILIGILASLIVFTIYGLVELILTEQNGMYFWILAGIAMVCREQKPVHGEMIANV